VVKKPFFGVSQGDFCKKATKLRDFGMG